MGDVQKLYRNALKSPNNFRFDDLCALAQGVGFKKRKDKGSGHVVFKHSGIEGLEAMMNFQEIDGKAKPYQVRQLLKVIDKHKLLENANVPVQD